MSRITPEFVYHGSINGDIKEFEPRKRYTPGGADVPARVYAALNPAIAAAHSFPWSSDDGIDIDYANGRIVLVVPTQLASKLDQVVYVYKIKGDNFELTSEDETNETYHSTEKVSPIEVTKFDSAKDAVEHFGGQVKFV